jgi:phosphatidylserine decarboxylase
MPTRQIEPFVREYHIDMSEFEPVRYRSFAEFFDRRFRPGVRTFPSAPGEMGAFAEARYLAWDRLEPGQEFPVKGHSLDAEQILVQLRAARVRGGGGLVGRKNCASSFHRDGVPTRRGKVGLPLRRLRLVFGEPGAWQPTDDLIARTKEGVETFVRLGEALGLSPTKH